MQFHTDSYIFPLLTHVDKLVSQTCLKNSSKHQNIEGLCGLYKIGKY